MSMRIVQDIEELKTLVGEKVAMSEWTTISQERINLFAEATGDDQWIHIDPERCAKESPFGVPIAHGFLTLSMIPDLDESCFQIEQKFKMRINQGLNKIRFLTPVRVGSRIRVVKKLSALGETDGGWRATWKFTIDVENEKNPACIAEIVMRYIV